MATLLLEYGGVNIVDELNGARFHDPSNILTLRVDVHGLFDDLILWFEKVAVSLIHRFNTTPGSCFIQNTEYTYNVRVTRPGLAPAGFRSQVNITTNTNMSLPNPWYPALRAALCKAACRSGYIAWAYG